MLRTALIAVGLVCVVGCATSGNGSSATRREQQREQRAAAAAAPVYAEPVPAVVPKVMGPKKRIGIVDFENTSSGRWYGGRGDALAEAARDVFTEALVKSGAFVVIEREQIAAIMREQGFGQTGALSPQAAAKAGKLLGLQAIVTGKITDFGDDVKSGGFGGYYQSSTRIARARVSLRMSDATTGEIWLAESGEGKVESKSSRVMGAGSQNEDQTLGKRALYGAIEQLMAKIIANANSKPWAGSVVKSSTDKVYITGGSDIGLTVGTMLEVRKLGEELKDPMTGASMGREVGKVVGTLQIASHLNEKVSTCVAVSGAAFAPGDVVTLASAAQ